MHFTTFSAAALALVQVVLAAPSSAPVSGRDTHKADFRSFGAAGCSEDNQGVWTLLESDNNVCKPFGFTVGSILVASDDCSRESILLIHLIRYPETNGQCICTPTPGALQTRRLQRSSNVQAATGDRSSLSARHNTIKHSCLFGGLLLYLFHPRTCHFLSIIEPRHLF